MMRTLVAAATIAGLAMAAPAAQATPATGYLEICKKGTDVSGSFRFSIDGGALMTVGVGACSAPIQVAAGNHTVVEENTDWTAVSATRTIPQDRLISSSLATRTDVVAVPAGDISTVTTVEYTNRPVVGTLEVCKSAQVGSGFSGSASFRVTGPMGFSRTLTVPVGACSASFDVPAGDQTEVQEIGANAVNLVGINTIRAGDLLAFNLINGTSRLRVRAGGVDNETIVTFVNGTSRLKICKVAGTASLVGTVYSFTANDETVNAVAQPAPGGCVLVDHPFQGGTRVDIQEAIVPGTGTTAIDVSNNRAVPGTVNLNNRSVSVILGSGETVVTYTNQVVSPGLLKVCKNASAGVEVGRVFSFNVSGRTDPLLVPAGYCSIAGTFAFNSTVTVTEAATAGLSVISGAAFPSSQLVAVDLLGRIVRARIGASVTEVAFTNATTGTPSTAPSTGSSPSANTPAPVNMPTTTTNGSTGAAGTPVVSNNGVTPAGANSCTLTARLVRARQTTSNNKPRVLGSHDVRPVLVLQASGNARVCRVLIRQLGLHGAVISRKTMTLKVGKTYRIKVSSKTKRVRTAIR